MSLKSVEIVEIRDELSLKSVETIEIRDELSLKSVETVDIRDELSLKSVETVDIRDELSLKSVETVEIRDELSLKSVETVEIRDELLSKSVSKVPILVTLSVSPNTFTVWILLIPKPSPEITPVTVSLLEPVSSTYTFEPIASVCVGFAFEIPTFPGKVVIFVDALCITINIQKILRYPHLY